MPKSARSLGLFSPSLARRPAPFRIALFVALLLLLWLPVYGLILWQIADSNTASILAIAAVFAEFLALLQVWSRTLYRARLRDRYGLAWTRPNRREFALGFGVAALSLMLLFGLQGLLGWVSWRGFPPRLGAIALEGLLVAVGVALGEELVFRGWLLGELEDDYSHRAALWGSSLGFAALHFIKPVSEMVRTVPQFPGLVLLGLVLVWARRSARGRLGLSIGLHAGLVWGYYLVAVGEWITYRDEAPLWLSGIDQNPLAGGLGLLCLSGLGLWVRLRRP
ncbi:MAG: CPBP family intramembrane glutamic endopeptidase [Elainellaceae cyanobacterium]